MERTDFSHVALGYPPALQAGGQDQLDEGVIQADLSFEAVGVGSPDVMHSCVGVAWLSKFEVDVFLCSTVLANQTSQVQKAVNDFQRFIIYSDISLWWC